MFVVTALLAGISSETMAQYVCPPGYTYYGGACQPVVRSYSNPVSGAVSGEAAGAAISRRVRERRRPFARRGGGIPRAMPDRSGSPRTCERSLDRCRAAGRVICLILSVAV